MTNLKKKLAALGLGGWVVLAGMALFALFVAFVVVPMISENTGIADETVSFAGAALCFVIVIACLAGVKFMNKKDKNRNG